MSRRSLLRDVLLTAAGLGLLALVVTRPDGAGRETVDGRARAVDGDTLAVGTTRVRLSGIDAPELHQTCGRDGATWDCGMAARGHLARLIAGRAVACEASGKDRYRRTLAVCTVDGTVLNTRIVRDGYAVAFGGFETEEAEARARRRGIWSGDFIRPRDWRTTHGGMAEVPHMNDDRFRALWRRIEGLWTTP